MAHRLDHDLGAVPAGELADILDAFLTALGNDVRGAELEAEVGAALVPTHEDDLLRAQPPSRLAAKTASRPTAPSPIALTVVPCLTPPLTAAWYPVPRTSDSVSRDGIRAESSATGSFTRVPSANGARTASPWPPSTPGAPPHTPPCRRCRPA